jgi:hypothetical protein
MYKAENGSAYLVVPPSIAKGLVGGAMLIELKAETPKSQILGVKHSSNKILLLFKSL